MLEQLRQVDWPCLAWPDRYWLSFKAYCYRQSSSVFNLTSERAINSTHWSFNRLFTLYELLISGFKGISYTSTYLFVRLVSRLFFLLSSRKHAVDTPTLSVHFTQVPLVVYRLTGNVMTSVTILRTEWCHDNFLTREMIFKVILKSFDK